MVPRLSIPHPLSELNSSLGLSLNISTSVSNIEGETKDINEPRIIEPKMIDAFFIIYFISLSSHMAIG